MGLERLVSICFHYKLVSFRVQLLIYQAGSLINNITSLNYGPVRIWRFRGNLQGIEAPNITDMGGAGCAHLEKSWSSSMGRMTSHIDIYIYMKWKIKHVPKHQPD